MSDKITHCGYLHKYFYKRFVRWWNITPWTTDYKLFFDSCNHESNSVMFCPIKTGRTKNLRGYNNYSQRLAPSRASVRGRSWLGSKDLTEGFGASPHGQVFICAVSRSGFAWLWIVARLRDAIMARWHFCLYCSSTPWDGIHLEKQSIPDFSEVRLWNF